MMRKRRSIHSRKHSEPLKVCDPLRLTLVQVGKFQVITDQPDNEDNLKKAVFEHVVRKALKQLNNVDIKVDNSTERLKHWKLGKIDSNGDSDKKKGQERVIISRKFKSNRLLKNLIKNKRLNTTEEKPSEGQNSTGAKSSHLKNVIVDPSIKGEFEISEHDSESQGSVIEEPHSHQQGIQQDLPRFRKFRQNQRSPKFGAQDENLVPSDNFFQPAQLSLQKLITKNERLKNSEKLENSLKSMSKKLFKKANSLEEGLQLEDKHIAFFQRENQQLNYVVKPKPRNSSPQMKVLDIGLSQTVERYTIGRTFMQKNPKKTEEECQVQPQEECQVQPQEELEWDHEFDFPDEMTEHETQQLDHKINQREHAIHNEVFKASRGLTVNNKIIFF